jgi:hypothetical protein
MQSLSTILALLIGIAGWYYLFYSRAAHKLEGVESKRLNRMRVGLRRVGGLVLLLLAPMFFAGFHTVDADVSPNAFVVIWLAVMLLLGVNVLLAMVDVVLTWKISRARLAASRADS